MNRLEGKTAVITGAARGMGAEHARRFVAEGANVVLTDILEEEGQTLAEQLGDKALFIKHDVTKADEWENVVKDTEAHFGPIHILVNNAGISMNKPLLDISEEEYRRIVDINQVSVFLGMKAVTPSMQKAGQASIVNISSINGIVGGAIGYTDTKFAVRGMSKAAALGLAHYGIRVNSVHPGVIETPMIDQDDSREVIMQFAKAIPLQRIAQPEEVTSMVLYLASDEASYVTGAEFIIDGGITAQ